MNSVISQSKSLSAEVTSKLSEATSKSIIFALFDQITQIADLPNFITILPYLYINFQWIDVSIFHPDPWDKPALFTGGSTSHVTLAILFSIVFVITMFSVIFPLVFFKYSRRFPTWSIYFARFCLEILIPVFLVPIATEFGYLFTDFSREKQSSEIIILIIIEILYLVILLVIYIISQILLSKSIYMSRNVLYACQGLPLIIVHTVETLMIFFINIFSLLPSWTNIMLIIFHSVVCFFLIALLFNLPFYQYYINTYFMAILSMLIVSNITYIANIAVPIRKIIIFVVFIVMFVVYSIIINLIVKKTAKLLNAAEGLDQNTVNDYMHELRADQKITFYIHVGIKERCKLFLNFSLIKYGLEYDKINCLRVTVLFPSQGSLLNVIYKETAAKLDLLYGDRFMLYQINRVKYLRQSSSFVSASEQHEVLKNRTKLLRDEIKAIWTEGDVNYSSVSKLGNDINLCNTSWKEAIKEIPNSQLLRDEYIKFLVEVETNFKEACLQQFISNLIGAGKNFSNDNCFKSLIQVNPYYLKKGIVDIKGNLLVKNDKKKGSTNNSSKSMSESVTSSLDAKMEEQIGHAIIKQARLRLALQNALEGRKSNNLKRLTLFIAFNFVIGIAAFMILFFMFKNFFKDRFKDTEQNMNANQMQLNFFLTALYGFLGWTDNTTPPRFDRHDAEIKNETFLSGLPPLWNGEDFFLSLGDASEESRKYYRAFITGIAESAFTIDAYKRYGAMLSEDIDMPLCAYTFRNGTTKVNLKVIYLGLMSGYSLLNSTGLPYPDWWTNNTFTCMGYSGTDQYDNAVIELRENMTRNAADDSKESTKLFTLLEILIPICVGVIDIVPFTLFFVLSIKETDSFIKMMLKISDDQKSEAAKPLLRNESQVGGEQDQVQKATGSTTILGLVTFFAYIGFIVQIVMIFLLLMQCSELNDKYRYMDFWMLQTSMREPIIIDIALSTFQAILTTGARPLRQNAFSNEKKHNRSSMLIEKMAVMRTDLLIGNDDVRSILGFNQDIDDVIIKPNCETNTENTTLHDTYVCASLSQQIAYFEGMITDMNTKIQELNSSLENVIVSNLIHIMLAHCVPQLIQLDNLLNDLMVTFIEDFDTMYLILFIIGLLITLYNTLLSILVVRILQIPYQTVLKIIKRVHPIGLVNNADLIDYLLNRSSTKQASEMNTTRTVLHNWNDAVIILSGNGTIENINLELTKIIGYTPEQLLGQHVSILLCEEDKPKIIQQLQLISSKQSPPFYEDHWNSISDTETVVPCFIMIFGMNLNNDQNGEINSFVVILRDETELVQYQKDAELAKKQSEELLYQILPRDVVIRLNQGEKDISFEVPSASVMFIDIVKFSEFSAVLTPAEIMGTLSTLFGTFDEALAKFPLITKIKLIGDVYMCASGLFSPDDPPQSHAEQLLKFGLEALQIVDEMNVRLTTNLSVRIGMNSGGPLIAGVLGTDKPVFDIIGDTINVASRLQSTDIPSRIQISQGTYDLISGLDFNVDPRGEIFLKGKGKTNAFLVRPVDPIGCVSSSVII